MGLPGIPQILGMGAAIVYRWLDPRAKKDRLLDAKENITNLKANRDRADRLAVIDAELIRVQREIDRRAGD